MCVDFSVRDDCLEPRRVVLRVLLGPKATNVPRRRVQRQLDGGLGRGIALFHSKKVKLKPSYQLISFTDYWLPVTECLWHPRTPFLCASFIYWFIYVYMSWKQLKAEFILIIIYLQANMNVESLLTQFLSVQKKTNTSHVMEYGDKVWLLRTRIWCISRQNKLT